MLDDRGLRQLIENVPVELETGLGGERSEAVVRGVAVGQFTENVTFLDNVMDLESGNRHQKMLFMRVVNGKPKGLELKRNVCCVRRLLPLKLEMEATKKAWHFQVKLGE